MVVRCFLQVGLVVVSLAVLHLMVKLTVWNAYAAYRISNDG